LTEPATERWAESLIRNVGAFSRRLRAAGVHCLPSQVAEAIAALDYVDVFDPAQFYEAMRLTLTSREEELRPFDRVFEDYWKRPHLVPYTGSTGAPGEERPGAETANGDEEVAGAPHEDAQQIRPRRDDAASAPAVDRTEALEENGPGRHQTMPAMTDHVTSALSGTDGHPPSDNGAVPPLPSISALERLARTDLSQLDDADARTATAMLRAILPMLPNVRHRRYTYTSSARGRLDMRGIMREGAKRGDVILLRRMTRSVKTAPIAVVCDISRSMAGYFPFIITFCHALVHAADVEAFTFSTRLKCITSRLGAADPEHCLDELRDEELAWSSGTSIGRCLAEFSSDHAGLLARRPVVLIFSDGWDSGDHELLAGQVRAIAMQSRLVVWLNPRMGDPEFAPAAGGMKAVLPHVDLLLPCHNLQSLQALLDWLRHQGRR
jgi:uncharacterized protein with von Willebrand factor type A (vWA) domain